MTRLVSCSPILLLTTISLFADCTCRKIEKGETTHWGGNELILQIEEKSRQELRGVVLDHSGEPMSGALVEVFTDPEYLLRDGRQSPDDKAKQKKLKVCRTGPDGKFCVNTKSGRYEVRVSFDKGWDVTKAYVIIDRHNGQKTELTIRMHIGV